MGHIIAAIYAASWRKVPRQKYIGKLLLPFREPKKLCQLAVKIRYHGLSVAIKFHGSMV